MIRRIQLVCVVWVIVTGLGLTPRTMLPQTSAATPETVWYWFGGHCRENKAMTVEILLNGKRICRSSFSICRMSRAAFRPHDQRLVFFFKGGHVFQGQYRTTPAQTIEANIWEAGGDPSDLLLGISFSTKNQVLLNTVHITRPERLSVSTLDPGLIIKTYPASGSVRFR